MGILELPEGYAELRHIDLQRDRLKALLINIGAMLIMVLFLILGLLLQPLSVADVLNGLMQNFPQMLLFLLATIVYIIGHELVHGVFFKAYSGKKAKYGFTGMYAYAASEAYYTKRQFFVISLSPIFLFGLLFLILNIVLPQWFWFIYLLQITNLSGAAGDMYVSCLLCKDPADVLVQDEGISMTFYTRVQ